MNYFYIIILLSILLIFLMINSKSESFDYNDFYDNLNYRIANVKYPYDKIIPLRPINVKSSDCEICVFYDNHKFYEYGDYIAKKKNIKCPPNSVYMNSCQFVNTN